MYISIIKISNDHLIHISFYLWNIKTILIKYKTDLLYNMGRIIVSWISNDWTTNSFRSSRSFRLVWLLLLLIVVLGYGRGSTSGWYLSARFDLLNWFSCTVLKTSCILIKYMTELTFLNTIAGIQCKADVKWFRDNILSNPLKIILC